MNHQIPPFIHTLWFIVNDPKTSSIINWTPAQTKSFTIFSLSELQRIMPHYFKHNRLSSFVRQLNHYGFQRCRSYFGEQSWFHPNFISGRKDLLKGIKRRNSQIKRAAESSPTRPECNPDCCGVSKKDNMTVGEFRKELDETKAKLSNLEQIINRLISTFVPKKFQNEFSSLMDQNQNCQIQNNKNQQKTSFEEKSEEQNFIFNEHFNYQNTPFDENNENKENFYNLNYQNTPFLDENLNFQNAFLNENFDEKNDHQKITQKNFQNNENSDLQINPFSENSEQQNILLDGKIDINNAILPSPNFSKQKNLNKTNDNNEIVKQEFKSEFNEEDINAFQNMISSSKKRHSNSDLTKNNSIVKFNDFNSKFGNFKSGTVSILPSNSIFHSPSNSPLKSPSKSDLNSNSPPLIKYPLKSPLNCKNNLILNSKKSYCNCDSAESCCCCSVDKRSKKSQIDFCRFKAVKVDGRQNKFEASKINDLIELLSQLCSIYSVKGAKKNSPKCLGGFGCWISPKSKNDFSFDGFKPWSVLIYGLGLD